MTDKEVGELRRRLRPDRTNITAVCGCYVSGNREILSQFRQSVALMREEDKETYLGLFKRVLSGTPDKNRLDLAFTTAQVADSDEHRLLMALRNTALKDDETLTRFYAKIVEALQWDGNYLILLAHERYDVPFKTRDTLALDDASEEVFSYVLGAVCPVKPGKSVLGYCAEEKEFHNQTTGWAAAAPEAGFLFPAFDGRRTNLYNALYYTRSAADNHPELIDALFHIPAPQPADEQRAAFGALLRETLRDDCSFEVMQAVQDDLRQRIEVHKETKSEDPLVVERDDVCTVLEQQGIAEEKRAAFRVEFDQSFGDSAQLSPRNLVSTRKTELKLPDVTIQVAPERGDLVQTRVLGGVPYLLIRAEEGVELNGVPVQMPEA